MNTITPEMWKELADAMPRNGKHQRPCDDPTHTDCVLHIHKDWGWYHRSALPTPKFEWPVQPHHIKNGSD